MSFAGGKPATGMAGGRPPLPGIPAKIDRLAAENMWKAAVDTENNYLLHRKRNPPKASESFMLNGYEVIQRTTHIEVRRKSGARRSISEQAEAQPQATSTATAGLSGSASSPALTTLTPALRGSPGAMMHALQQMPKEEFEARAAAISRWQNEPLVLPKYSQFSCEHMTELESLDRPGWKTGENFKRVLRIPVTNQALCEKANL
mmetsp:Transcript_35287/g.82374  ORF Transcript_35287/g.82374 Transcript_35287/m.82374 type:complete len:204 (+) Transcript_35287:102-713(+)